MNAPFDHGRFGRDTRRSRVAVTLGALLSLALAVAVIGSTTERLQGRRLTVMESLTRSNGSLSVAETSAKKLLVENGPDAGLLSALGAAADHQGRKDDAARLMTLAGTLSWRDVVADAWLLQHDFITSNASGAIDRADALLRVQPEIGPTMYPILVSASANPAVDQAIVKRLAFNPNWRPAFLGALTAKAEPAMSYGLLELLQSTRSPVTPTEAAGYVQRLVDLKQYNQALLGMILFLPQKDQSAYGNLFNGAFDDVRGIAPFDWMIHAVSGASVAIEPRTDQPTNRALHVFFDGNATNPLLYQILVLSPGTYRLTGKVSSTTPETSDRLQWSLNCHGGEGLAKQGFKSTSSWTPFNMTFTVPKDNCGGQVLQLAPAPADRGTTAEIWYDDLAITQIEAPQ
jgi:hypothetical protein